MLRYSLLFLVGWQRRQIAIRILMLSPHLEQTRGNTITVRRMAKNLRTNGVTCEVRDSTSQADHDKDTHSFDLWHGFHAYHFSLWLDAQPQANKVVPYVLTCTGTDVNHDL